MKGFSILVVFLLLNSHINATNPYIRFLVNSTLHNSVAIKLQHEQTTPAIEVTPIPRYQIPKGAIFCRMEDKLTKATGIWIKVGVK